MEPIPRICECFRRFACVQAQASRPLGLCAPVCPAGETVLVMDGIGNGFLCGKDYDMLCKKCPHHVRHGHVGNDGKTIEFNNRCGLRMKTQEQVDCHHYPFAKGFDYVACTHYLATFKTADSRNDVVPKSDFEYSERLASNSITEMELL